VSVLGGVVIVVLIVLVLPVLALMSGAVAAAILGYFLKEDAEATHEGSELVELNR
jgi:hypothetical protein